MPVSPNGAAARETVIPMQTGNVSRSTLPNHRKRWRFWRGACFAVVLLAVFAQPLLALINYAAGSQLYSCIYWYRSFPLSIPLEILQAKVAVGSTATFCFNLPARILVDGVEAVVVLIAFRRFAQFPGNERQRTRSGEEKGCGYDHDQTSA